MSRPSWLASLLAAILTLSLAAFAAESPAPVVVAVDTSRSLTVAELDAVTEQLAAVLERLPPDQPTGLLAFDDTPRWEVAVGSSPQEVAAALGSLRPQGDNTLLHDALFAAARALPEGGVILVATDGKDENSATTVEDVARLVETQAVRILTVGVGRRLQERALRRLALLTAGEYLGAPGPERLAAAVRAAQEGLGAARRTTRLEEGAEAERAGPPPAVPAPTASPPAPSVEVGVGPATWVLLGFGGAALALGLAILVRRRLAARVPGAAHCDVCSRELPAAGGDCPHCRENELHLRLAGCEITRLEDTAEFDLAALEAQPPPATPPGVLEVTRVLTEQHVLVVREPGRDTRSFLLRSESAFAVGRAPEGNTLPMDDPSVSAHHVKIVPDQGLFYAVDLGSTNGTLVNDERVKLRRLRSGDVVRVGQTELELRSTPLAMG